jgi:hypothetical protein
MNKRILHLLFFTVACILSLTFTNGADAKVAKATFTEIGYQKDAAYIYTFYINLSKEQLTSISYIQVQNSTGSVLKLEGFDGKVAYWKGSQFTIKDTATVSFYDGDKLVTKNLTGLIEGGVKL